MAPRLGVAMPYRQAELTQKKGMCCLPRLQFRGLLSSYNYHGQKCYSQHFDTEAPERNEFLQNNVLCLRILSTLAFG